MDTTEIHYLTLDPDALWRRMTQAHREAGGGVLYPGNEKEMLLRGVQADILQAAADMDNALRMDTLRYAVRGYLDLYGEKRGCYRIAAKAAEADVIFYLSSIGVDSTIPAGTTVTEDGETIYATTEDISVSALDVQKEAHVVCTTTGRKGNSLTAGAEMQVLNQMVNVLRVEAKTNATGGQNAETDDAYRERIRTFGLEGVTTGPSARYEATAAGVSSEIIDVNAVNGGPGIVNVYILAEDGADMETILSDAAAALNDEHNRPLTDDVHIYAAQAVPYVLHVSAVVPAGMESAVQQAADEYITWQERMIGRAYNPDVLFARLYQAGAERVTWQSGCSFNNRAESVPQYHEITSGQVMRGSVELVVS